MDNPGRKKTNTRRRRRTPRRPRLSKSMLLGLFTAICLFVSTIYPEIIRGAIRTFLGVFVENEEIRMEHELRNKKILRKVEQGQEKLKMLEQGLQPQNVPEEVEEIKEIFEEIRDIVQFEAKAKKSSALELQHFATTSPNANSSPSQPPGVELQRSGRNQERNKLVREAAGNEASRRSETPGNAGPQNEHVLEYAAMTIARTPASIHDSMEVAMPASGSTERSRRSLTEASRRAAAPMEHDKLAQRFEDLEPAETEKISARRNFEFDGLIDLPASRSRTQLREVILKHKPALEYCYTQALKHDPALKGRIEVRVVVFPSGKVAAATLVSSTVNNDRLERLVLEKIRRWSDFGEVRPEAGNVAFRQTFVFGGSHALEPLANESLHSRSASR
jgi:TonB family protein